MKNPLSQDNIKELLDNAYVLAVKGGPGMKDSTALANEYITKYPKTQVAIDRFIKAQLKKATATGFLTGIGGLITLPIAIPADLAGLLIIQLRTIVVLAIIGGYNPNDDEVKTLVYACLINYSIVNACKQAGIKMANKFTIGMIDKIPGHVIRKINQMTMQRAITKFGSTGAVNLVDLVPFVGGFIGGAIDGVSTSNVAKRAKKFFIDNELF